MFPKWEDIITPEMIAALPEGERAKWQQVLDQAVAQKALVVELAADRKFGEALVFVDSKERADRLITWDEIYDFTDDEARELIADFWSVTEAWSGDERLRNGMMGLLERAGQVVVDGPIPDGEWLTVYRGNLGERPGSGSWTLDRETAERFARMANSLRGEFLGMKRDGGVPSIWRAEVDRAKILGYFDDREEKEVVVYADALRNVELIAQETKGGTP